MVPGINNDAGTLVEVTWRERYK